MVGDHERQQRPHRQHGTSGTGGPAAQPPLGPLANNGGTVQTFALLPGSPAIDLLACPIDPITNATLASDARGVSVRKGRTATPGRTRRAPSPQAPLPATGRVASEHRLPQPPGPHGERHDGRPRGRWSDHLHDHPRQRRRECDLWHGPGGCTNTSTTVSVCTVGIAGVVTSPPFTANGTLGGFTIVATATGVPTTTFNETNIPGPAARFTVTGCPSPIVSGTACTVTVTAQDANSNTATGYTGTVAITSSDARAVLPANATLTNGVGTFTVTLRTPGMQSITATDTVTGTITGAQTGITVTGTTPAAVNDSYTVTTGLTLTVPAATGVLANDTKGTPVATITANTQPAHGSVTVNADGSFIYTPMSGYVGSDSFTYTMTNSVGTSTGTVTITVTGTAPTATNDSYTVTTGLTLTVPAATGVLANDTRGNPVATITANTQAAHGSVTVNSDGSVVYTPTAGYVGNDSFTYTLTNSVGTSTSTVSLTVTAATVIGLTTTAPTGTGSDNTGTASNPVLPLGGRLTLTTSASYNNGTTGSVSGLNYTSSNPGVASVDPVTGVVTANTAGSVTITVTGPNGSRTMLTVTVPGAAGTGLMPMPQPMAHPGAAVTGAGTAAPLPQPARHP